VPVPATEFEVFMAPANPPTAPAANRPRPLSPHLQIYRWQWTMALSITHRATGVFLSAGALYLVIWLAMIAGGPDSFAAIQHFNVSIVGRLLLLAWTFSLFFHLCNGIRHLVWDAGRGFELKTGHLTAVLVIVASVGLTALAWLAAYLMRH
jgi:succinate dehydrogenase / fumarate reductase cytochrome b subunit